MDLEGQRHPSMMMSYCLFVALSQSTHNLLYTPLFRCPKSFSRHFHLYQPSTRLFLSSQSHIYKFNLPKKKHLQVSFSNYLGIHISN